MMTPITGLLILSVLCAGGKIEEEKASEPPVTAELQCQERDGTWRFSVSGTADLPDGTKLEARLHVFQLKELGDKRRVPVEEPVMLFPGPGSRTSWHAFEVRNGTFGETVNTFDRKPYSIIHRIVIRYRPERQTEAVREKTGTEPWRAHADLRLGTDEDFARERAEATRDFIRDLDALQALLDEFLSITALGEETKREPLVDGEWEKWKKSWNGRVETVLLKNGKRFDFWMVRAERSGKKKIHRLCDYLTFFGRAADRIRSRDTKLIPVALRKTDEFQAWMRDARELVGVNRPKDSTVAIQFIEEYAELFREIGEAIGKNGKPDNWGKKREEIRRKAREHLLRQVSNLTKHGQDRITTLTRAMESLLEGCNEVWLRDGEADLDHLLKAHMENIDDFRKYAAGEKEE